MCQGVGPRVSRSREALTPPSPPGETTRVGKEDVSTSVLVSLSEEGTRLWRRVFTFQISTKNGFLVAR